MTADRHRAVPTLVGATREVGHHDMAAVVTWRAVATWRAVPSQLWRPGVGSNEVMVISVAVARGRTARR
ncbi:MAG TPA: hypothetical protein VFC16_02805 [Nakamurella sp.]|nr:hypothetical protein [Nakamurella sp.]